ncbi:MAG: GNAT family N-acetyltransferase [Moraxella sp.]|nr:GNAT family N-acetyltransferase [Moraxella sp.]
MIYQSFSRQEMNFVIKDVSIDDIPTITRLYNQGNKTANANIEPVNEQSRREWLASHGQNRPIIGIYHNDEMVAWASLSNLYDRPAYHISTEVSVYIDEPYKGQGLGSELLDTLLKLAKTLGIKNIVALIFGENVASLSLFGKFHFENWGYLPKVCLIDGVHKDVLILGRTID